MKPKYGYAAVTADYLHVGHLNYLEECSRKCQRLVVGIMTDACVKHYKGKPTWMNQNERARIIGSLKIVHKTLFQDSFNFSHHVFRLKEHYGKDFVIFDSEEHAREGADILIPRTKGISSTILKEGHENINHSQLPL